MKRVLQSLALVVLVGMFADCYASIVTVTSSADAGIGTLRNSVDSASAGDTITVDPSLSGALISLVSGEIVIDKDLTIVGLGGSNIAVTANNLSRIFNVSSGVNAIIAGWTLAQGTVTGDGGGILNAGALNLDDIKLLGCVASGNGGGVYSTGTVTTNETVIKSCIASGNGGGIYGIGNINVFFSTVEDNEGINGAGIYGEALVEVANSLLGDNIGTGNGAAIYVDSLGTTLVSKTMVSGNSANGNGGGIFTLTGNIEVTRSTFTGNIAVDGGAVYTLTDFSTENTTYSGNTATSEGGATYVGEKFLSRGNTYTLNDAGTDGGAIFLVSGVFLRINEGSIVYGNTIGGATADDISNASTLFSSTYNIYGVIDDAGFTAGSGDQIGADPMLVALTDNGGETLTHAVACGSAAIDAGNPSSSLVLDQRSELRPFGGGHDVGSFELQDTCVAGPTCFIDSVQLDSLGSCDPLTDTYTAELTVYYSDAPITGSLEVNGQTYAIGASPQIVTLTGLVSDGLVVDATASFTDDVGCTLTALATWTAPVSCFVPPCLIDAIVVVVQTPCNSSTNVYEQVITISYTNAPATGSLDVNGQLFAITSSPQTVTLTGLVSDGLVIDATASFTDDAGCTLTELALWTAPPSCAIPVDCVTLTPIGLTSTQLGSGAMELSWDPVPQTLACRLNGKPVSAPVYAIVSINSPDGTPPTRAVIGTSVLTDGLSYDWRIKCACAVPLPMTSEITQFSAVDTFTYIAPRLENPDQIDLAELTVYPNPTEAGIFVTSPVLPLGDVFLEVMDMAGRVYHTSKFESAGMIHQVEINSVSGLPAGNYIVSMRHSEGVYQSSFSKID